MDNFVYLPEIKDDNSQIEKVSLQWLLSDDASVCKNDVIMNLITDSGNIYPVISHRSGILIRFFNDDIVVAKSKYNSDKYHISDITNVCIGGVFNSYKEYVDSFYKFKDKVEIDSFTKEKIISWVYVAEPIKHFPFVLENVVDNFIGLSLLSNDLDRRDVSMGIQSFRKTVSLSNVLSPYVGFSYIFIEGRSFIEFSYSIDKVRLRKNDTISILFRNHNIINFKLPNSSYKKKGQGDLYFVKCLLYAEDLETLLDSYALKWKITFFDDSKNPISGDIEMESNKDNETALWHLNPRYSFWHNQRVSKTIPYLIHSYTQYFCEVLKREVPDFEHPKKLSDNAIPKLDGTMSNPCYIYLMKDISNNFYKIGIAKKPEYREHTLQSEKPTIELICCKELPDRKIARAFEKALHDVFNQKRKRGEWFILDDKDVAQIVESLK